MIRHIVLFKVKEEVDEKEILKLFSKFSAVQKHIQGIEHFYAGYSLFPSARNLGYNVGLCVDFAHKEALNEYITHPIHQEFKEKISAYLKEDQLLVFDLRIS